MDEELIIQSFDTDKLIPSSISLIIGDKGSGKSILIKDLILSIQIDNHIPQIRPKTGIVCVNKSQYPTYESFIESCCIYNRYSSLLATRCYSDNTYMVLDYYFYNKEKYSEIYENVIKHKMVLLVSLFKLTDFLDYTFIFITKFSDLEELIKIYNIYIKNKFTDFLTFEQFIHLLKEFEEYEVLILNCKAIRIDDLFYSYIPEIN